MTVTTHIAEILRQGIWASLTGGWYYEPAHTIFCNTVHLYLWLLLLIVPLVIGLATAGAFSLPIIIAYTAFVGLMFIALKVIVSYLHIVFDTTEPVITTKGNENSEVTTIGDINEDGMQLQEIRSGTNSRPVLDIRANATDSDDGGIEMRDIRRTDRTEGRPARSRLMDAANARQAARRRVRIEFEPRDENIGPVDVADVEMEFRTRGTFMGKLVPSEQRTAVLEKIIAMEMKAQNLREEAYSSRSRREEATSSSHVPFSLLEIDEDEAALAGPEVEVEEVRDDVVAAAGHRSSTPVSKSGMKSKASHGASGMRRKLSEPALTADGFPWNEGRRCSDGVMGDAARVRRANSTFEPRRNHREKGMLSQSSLTQARQNTNKSYPSKMSSDDEFKRLVKEGRLAVSSTSDNHVVSDASEADCDADVETDAEMAQYNMQPWKDVGTTRVFGPQVGDYDDEPCCSTSSARVVTRPGTPIEPLIGPAPRLSRDFDPEHISERAMSSSSAWIPVVVSLSDSDRPSTSTALARISDEKQAMIDGITDIKGEITKFLEDLIDKHPETLDAIESVRQSRLGRTLVMPRGVTTSIRNSSVRRGSGSSAVFSDLTIKDGTHVASGHEDTTQGALHSFQDEDGNWWTYSFDEHGVGTAQPLGSGTALMEIIQRERSHDSVTGKRVLDALPESEFGSTDDEDEVTEAAAIQLPSTSRQPSGGAGSSGGTSGGTSGRVVTTTRRERALSSSSNESYTYIPSVPTAVMHAGTGTTATRSSRNMVSFANVASRLRSSLRQSSEERLRQGELDQIIELLDRGRAVSSVGAGGGGGGSVGTGADRHRGSGSSASALHLRMMQMQERMFRLDSVDSTSSSTRRILHEMGLMGGDQPFTPTAADFMSPPRRPTVKRRYYYQMKMFPKTDKSFKLKLDRLAVAALFDRNRSLLSCCFDIFLACLVSLLAGLVLSTGIFYDVSLFFFAFCVAGAHFSLLKSVQPDAASPIHGFNWLVAYSRPIYFCLLCSVMLGLHYLADDPQNEKIPWNWNPYRLGDVNSTMILIAARDLVGTFLVLLPLCFTLGWLPQVNTLAHHVLEQTEMHLFGGTASLGVFSAAIQLTKSAAAWAALAIVCHFARVSSPSTTQSPAFSGFVALSVGLSYLLSRFSSNPQLTAVLLRSMWQSVRSAIPSRLFPATTEPGETVDEAVGDKDTVDSLIDPLPGSLRTTISLRARHDVFFATVISLAVFALHSTSVFTATRPYFMLVIVPLCVCVSTFNHYLYLQLRAHTPWKLIANPILRSGEFSQFECVKEARLMAFERFHVWSQAIERNVLYPLLIVCQLCDSAWHLPLSVFLSPLIAIRLLRGSFSHPQLMYVPLTMSYLVTRFDWAQHMPFGLETVIPSASLFCLSFFLFVVVYPKWLEFYLKCSFIMAYVAPWQISWGSAFHAFAQPFSVPHSALILAQTVVSSIISAPLNPFLGSSFFMTSYVRPVKFWERDYNTKRSDASNTRLASQIDRGPMLDDSNLNAVFYEHLTRSLQKSLAGDLQMGRWACSVEPGDCFILASFYLNCLVHIVEVGNGFVTFQLRGLEFRGTYCHQREVEAISEDQTEGAGFCCCSPGSLPGFLSLNTAWGLRWLAWEVVAAKYVIDGYSITDNSAVNLLQVHELRRLLVTLYVKCIIYYATVSGKLSVWLANDTVRAALDPIVARNHYVDIDHMFCSTNDEDYDAAEAGISRQSFSEWYMDWIRHCIRKRAEANPDEVINRDHVSCLCYMLSLLGRRALGTASHNRHSTAAESFLYGLHALFKGDFRIQCHRDEWVFADMDLLRCVISPAVKMALKLHQDHFASTDDFDDEESLYNLISEHQTKLFISHEQDPAWRRAILANTSSLLALRHMYDDGQDDYKIIMLNKMHLNMRVIKLNRECVRAFWAGQQQELIFLRNRNPERGSIQNARQVLRNMINSSADQPVGYPIYVSPLTTSYVDTHSQIAKVIGPPITIEGIGNGIISAWKGLRWYLGTSTSSSRRHGGCPPTNAASGSGAGGAGAASSSPKDSDVDRTSQQSGSSQAENSIVHMSADGTARVSLAKRSTGDTPTHQANQKKTSGSVGGGSATSAGSATGDTLPTTSGTVKRVSHERSVSSTTAADASVAGCSEEKDGGGVGGTMMGDEGSVVDGSDSGRDPYDSIPNENGDLLWLEVTDTEQIFKYLSEPLKSTGQPLVHWPDEEMRQFASAKNWLCTPLVGMIGRVIYIWYPNHPNKKKRSHIGDIIYLICVPMMANSLFVVGEKGARVRTEKEIKADMIRQNEEQEKENAKITADRDRLRELKRSEETTKTEEDVPEKSE